MKILAIDIGAGTEDILLYDDRKKSNENCVKMVLPSPSQLLVTFVDGKLSDETVFKDNGHGLFFLTKPLSFSKIEKVAATGPNRNILAKTHLSVHFAAPAGDVMMTGPIGLVEETKRRFKLE